jgi:ADP-ribose pyrophosphatase YjhB (NUDIX family)
LTRRYPDRPYLASSVAVVRDGRVLVAARAAPPFDGAFSLPGGGVELGESLADAALRELAEEVGVEADLLGLAAPVEIIERDEAGLVRSHFVILAHAARWRAGEPSCGPEAREVRWVSPDEIADLPATPGLEAVIRAALALASAAEGR